MTVINCNGKILDLRSPKIMGIINLTPDSFFAASRYGSTERALEYVDRMIQEGMDILDLGAASSRPNASIIDVDEEKRRLIPVLSAIRERYPDLLISIDTFRPEIVKEVVPFAPNFINDITGGKDPAMSDIIASTDIVYVLMHMQKSPMDMQVAPSYDNVTLEIFHFLKGKVGELKKKGIKDIIIDPGFGFGKTIEHNYKLLNDLGVFHVLECPILIGLSRKSMIHKLLNITPETALNGTTALHMVALLNGTNILRVHDVKEAKECVKLYQTLQSN